MTFDLQVLVIAFVAIALNLIVWGTEPEDRAQCDASLPAHFNDHTGTAIDSEVERSL